MRAVRTHTLAHVAVKTVVALSDTTAVNLSWRQNLFEGPSCMCVSLAELRGTMTGKKATGGEWGVSTQRVCIQALINSALLSSLAFLPSWDTCQFHGWCVFLVCVCGSTIICHQRLFLCSPPPSPGTPALPCQISWSVLKPPNGS